MQDQTALEPSGLQAIIAPEVYRDEFSDAIRNLARSAGIDSVLEIGSSSGEGSTLAWVEGLRDNPRKPRLYCMEVSKVRCAALEQRWGAEGFVECFLGSSVDLEQFPSEAEVTDFYRTVEGPLRQYPLDQVLGWLRDDIEYVKKEGVQTGRIREIKRVRGIKNFGAVLIDGSEFTGNAELDEVYGAEFILLDDTQTYKCHQAHHRLLHDPAYELIAENPKLRNGYSIFRRRHATLLDPLPADCPVHYFTIVLNGEPFIRHHIEVLKQLPFRWHWHIVEGAATLTHDTARNPGVDASLPDDRHRNGLSIDGTSAYLDDLASRFPGQVTLYRPPAGRLWDGKIAMVSEPLKHIFEDAILWEIDADELWTREQLEEGRRMFLRSPEKAAAWFWCQFYVGQRLVLASRDSYAADPKHDWLRAWRFEPGMKWLTHEPPALARRLFDGTWKNVAEGNAFSHQETEALGLVFQHFAYATEAQVAFKERYYGYTGAVEAWKRLQAAQGYPVLVRDYLPWVKDHTEANLDTVLGITPLAQQDAQTGAWTFRSTTPAATAATKKHGTVIVVDGIFFQFSNTGIGRVWLETLNQWVSSGVAGNVWLLDRDGTAPEIEGIRRHRIARYDPLRAIEDSNILQNACDLLKADIFISTYYTFPLSVPSVGMIYDMIPELMNLRGTDWQWDQKENYILNTSRFACISQSTANDLLRLHPEIPETSVKVTLLAASPGYRPALPAQVAEFRQRHGLSKDYLMLAGERVGLHLGTQGYKNASLAFRAWTLLPEETRRDLTILCAGGKAELEEEFRLIAPDVEVRIIRFSDEDLAIAYSGAVALVYASLYEGFGLPVVEAMACGCPVVTCERGSLGEAAGDAGLYVNPWSPQEAADVIQRLRADASFRARQVDLGLKQAGSLSFSRMAAELAEFIEESAQISADVPRSTERAIVQRAVASVPPELLKEIKDLKSELSAAKKKIKEAVNARKGAEKEVREERHRRRHPLKYLWKKFSKGDDGRTKEKGGK